MAKKNRAIAFAEFDFISSLDLRNSKFNGKPFYQLIYGSQLYGTHFDIYAKFNGTKVKLKDGLYKKKKVTNTMGECEAYLVKTVSFIIINYKGILNLGFTGKFTYRPGAEGKTFDLELQGASDNINASYKFKASTPLIIPKDEPVRMLFRRILVPLPDFKNLLSNVVNSGINQHSRLPQHPPITPLFDTEYFDRDGVDLYKHLTKPGMVGGEELGFFGPGGRCNNGLVSLLY